MGSMSENFHFGLKVAIVLLVIAQVPALSAIISKNYFA